MDASQVEGEAIESLRKTVVADPNNAVLQNRLGNLLFESQMFREAAEHYAAASRLAPREMDFLSNLAHAHMKLGKNEAAEREFKAVVANCPRSPEAWADLGVLLRRIGRPVEALESLLKATELGPSCARHWYELGMAQLAGGPKTAQAAKEAFLRALELADPKDESAVASCLRGRGVAESLLAEHPQAIATLLRCIEIRPGPAIYLHSLGKAYVRAGDDHAAIPYLEAAARADPKEPIYKASLRMLVKKALERTRHGERFLDEKWRRCRISSRWVVVAAETCGVCVLVDPETLRVHENVVAAAVERDYPRWDTYVLDEAGEDPNRAESMIAELRRLTERFRTNQEKVRSCTASIISNIQNDRGASRRGFGDSHRGSSHARTVNPTCPACGKETYLCRSCAHEFCRPCRLYKCPRCRAHYDRPAWTR